jgi:hypothetical protein
MDYDLHQALDNSSRLGMQKGIKGFQRRPGANDEIDKLVVDMILADWQGLGRQWSVLKALDRMNPAQCQQGLFGQE